MPDLLLYPALFLAATAAGFIDSIAGGGGLITVPALLLAGLPPSAALGTNKFQSSFGSLTASIRYARAGEVRVSDVISGIVFTALGASVGTIVVQMLNASLLAAIIPFLLLAVLILLVALPRIGKEDIKPRMQRNIFYTVFGLGLGFYDGFFGPGTGTLWVVAFMLLLGQNMKKATAHTKIMNFTSNIVALAWFLIGAKVFFAVGCTMALGQVIGARAGAGLVIRRGVGFIRPIFITMVTLATIKLFYDYFFS